MLVKYNRDIYLLSTKELCLVTIFISDMLLKLTHAVISKGKIGCGGEAPTTLS